MDLESDILELRFLTIADDLFYFSESTTYNWLSWWLSGKESASQAGDAGSIPGLGRSPGEENGNPLQYSCLGSPMDRGACRLHSMRSQRVKRH